MISQKIQRFNAALILFLALAGFLVFAGLGMASNTHESASETSAQLNHNHEEAGHQAGDISSGKILDLGYRILNFSLLVIILFVIYRKIPVKDFFASRREEIKKEYDNLIKNKEDSYKRYLELEQKLKEFENEKKMILEQFRAQGEAEKKRIIAEAENRAKQIHKQVDLNIDREFQAAKDLLKQELVETAYQRAHDIIAKEINEKDQSRLVNEFITKMEKLH